jgi:hypothetical protein
MFVRIEKPVTQKRVLSLVKPVLIKKHLYRWRKVKLLIYIVISKIRKMSVRKLKPITPGQRFRVVNGFDAITTDKPEKSLLAPKKDRVVETVRGKMTMRYVGGGHKRALQYRRF